MSDPLLDQKRFAEYRFRELLEVAPDAIFEIDSEGRIVLVNARAEQMFRYSREELEGQNVDILIPEALRATHVAHRFAYTSAPVVRPMGLGMELLACRKDGALLPVEISLSPLETGTGLHVMAIVRDVSERKRTEERLRQMQEQFTSELEAKNKQLEQRNAEVERANRLKSEFLATMSHELRSPLHTVIGFAELLAEELEGPLNDKQRRFVKNIHQDSGHLLAIINDILDISKIEAGRLDLRLEPVIAAEAVEEAVSIIRPQADAKDQKLESSLQQGLVVEADRLRIKQILVNLLSNAVKFTPAGGTISVTGFARPGKAVISVSDTGVGIPKEDLAAIFEKFYQGGFTTKGVREGTGLGLAITRRLVEQQGGRIWVDSEPGRGSRFTFTLRECLAPSAPDSPKPRPMVLIIQDEPQAAELLTNYLEPAGYQTALASNCEECIGRAIELRPDAIILDLFSPTSTCWTALRELQKRPETASIPVLVVSVAEEDERSVEVGATAHLTKPVSKKKLIEAIQRIASLRPAPAAGILVVDDEPASLDLAEHMLKEAGLSPILASSGPHALRLLKGGLQPAAIVLDLMMPEMSGFDLLMHLKSDPATAKIPVLILTGMELGGDDVETLRHAAIAILLKGSGWKSHLLNELRKLGL